MPRVNSTATALVGRPAERTTASRARHQGRSCWWYFHQLRVQLHPDDGESDMGESDLESHCDVSILGLQYLPPAQHPLNQRPHAKLGRYDQRLVQHGHGLLSVTFALALKEHFGVVAKVPGKPRIGQEFSRLMIYVLWSRAMTAFLSCAGTSYGGFSMN